MHTGHSLKNSDIFENFQIYIRVHPDILGYAGRMAMTVMRMVMMTAMTTTRMTIFALLGTFKSHPEKILVF